MRRVQPDILGYGRDHQANSRLWLFWQRFELEAKVSHCILRFNEAGLSHLRDESKGRRMLNGTLEVAVGEERSSVGMTIRSACSSVSLRLNPKEVSWPRSSSATVSLRRHHS